MPKGLFITSSGTGIGKTFVTAALMYQARIHYKQAVALKPVLSGVEDGMDGSDTDLILKAMGRGLSRQNIETITPFRYRAPLSPQMAAELEGRTLDFDALLRVCREALAAYPRVVIEGVGGAFVPLSQDKLVADWIKALELESLLVVGSYLGAQSHALATLEAMQARGLRVKAMIVSASSGMGHPQGARTAEVIAAHSGLETLYVPRIEGEDAWKRAPDLSRFLD